MEEGFHNSPQEYYQRKKASAENKVVTLKRQLLGISTLRLVVFALTLLSGYLLYPNTIGVISALIVGSSVFLLLVRRYSNLKYEKNFQAAIADVCAQELSIAQGHYKERPTGLEFLDSNHFYSDDIDLFGKGSFFQYLNRTSLSIGKEKLSEILLANVISGIAGKQEAIKELGEKPKWRLEFLAAASLIETDSNTGAIKQWIRTYKPFISKWQVKLSYIFGTISIVLIITTVLGLIAPIFLLYWLLFGIALSGVYFRKVSNLTANGEKAISTIKQFSTLMKRIESASFQSTLLSIQQSNLEKSGRLASEQFTIFSRALDHLDNRNNLIYALLGNGFFLTDLYHSHKIEKWIIKNRLQVEEWFNVISFFDAYLTLGTFSFNHPSFTLPELTESKILLDASHLGHPLIPEEARVLNDLKIKHEEFFIVTGANMAGKSTFLRTVSLHILMANTGLPVCASKSRYSPIKLITSMRATDSLASNSSYFFAELSRLKFIVDTISEEPYFIVLDEILKGTNSTDKALGSKKFLERLVKSRTTGIIATHDLSLCETADYLTEIKNFYFDALIENDELSFDYKLKEGICQNMNASFLLKKLNIIR